jgi:glyoxylase-like metal-dependent hydrolase (beta-lactamase superfamily II)
MVRVKIDVFERDDSVKIYNMIHFNNGTPFFTVTSFLIDGLLIDCGTQNAKDEFLKSLNFDEIDKCVLTHHHEDHIGACYDIINKHKIPIYANKLTAFLVSFKMKLPSERMFTSGTPKPCKVHELPSLKEIKTKYNKLKIIPSPGHCNNHISFYHEEKRFLISADSFIEKNVISNWEDANLMLETTKNFVKINPMLIFSSHGNIFTSDNLKKFVLYWTDIKEQSIRLFKQGIKPRQIVKRIFGKESFVKTATKGDVSRENLVRSLIGLKPIYNQRFSRGKKNPNFGSFF